MALKLEGNDSIIKFDFDDWISKNGLTDIYENKKIQNKCNDSRIRPALPSQSGFKEEESDEKIECCWHLFGFDLCGIVDEDLLYLFKSNQKESENVAKRRKINENGRMLISNKYGTMFILYPKGDLLVSFDSIEMTKYLNNHYKKLSDNLQHGIFPPKNLYRVFRNFKV